MLPDVPVTLGRMRTLLGPNLALLLSIAPHNLSGSTLDVGAAGDPALGIVAIGC
ncbi:MAG: hypothetical protein ACU0DJ_03810 [Paracoccus sp. (in: a-proteobacteria)]|nr:hypothetical protein [Pseudomonadota bacterium]